MKKRIIYLFILSGFFSCRNKTTDSTKAYFSVVDFLKSQVKNIDSVYKTFTKIVRVDSTRSDTIRVSKKEFNVWAKEFTSIPDIASSDKMDDYKEMNDYEESLGNVLLIYTPKKEDEEVVNETILMQPDEQGNTQVKTILIKTLQSNKYSTVEKNLTWHIDNHFQIVTKVYKPDQPEKVNTIVIQWE